jgi:hypothetical protein
MTLASFYPSPLFSTQFLRNPTQSDTIHPMPLQTAPDHPSINTTCHPTHKLHTRCLCCPCCPQSPRYLPTLHFTSFSLLDIPVYPRPLSMRLAQLPTHPNTTSQLNSSDTPYPPPQPSGTALSPLRRLTCPLPGSLARPSPAPTTLATSCAVLINGSYIAHISTTSRPLHH